MRKQGANGKSSVVSQHDNEIVARTIGNSDIARKYDELTAQGAPHMMGHRR